MVKKNKEVEDEKPKENEGGHEGTDDENIDEKYDHKSMNKRAAKYKVPKDLQDWKNKERKCTDSICCLIFSAFMGLCVYFGIVGYSNGNVDNVLAPVDKDGRICGYSDGVVEYPYLFIWNLDAAFSDPYNLFDYGYCIEKCPLDSNNPIKCATYTDDVAIDNCVNFIGRTVDDGPY